MGISDLLRRVERPVGLPRCAHLIRVRYDAQALGQ